MRPTVKRSLRSVTCTAFRSERWCRRGIDNLVVASPAISASHLASGSARVIPTTIEEGEAAGAACADADRGGIDIVQLAENANHLALLRHDLMKDGTIVGLPSPPRLSS